jgi:hypothetical protein
MCCRSPSRGFSFLIHSHRRTTTTSREQQWLTPHTHRLAPVLGAPRSTRLQLLVCCLTHAVRRRLCQQQNSITQLDNKPPYSSSRAMLCTAAHAAHSSPDPQPEFSPSQKPQSNPASLQILKSCAAAHAVNSSPWARPARAPEFSQVKSWIQPCSPTTPQELCSSTCRE